MYIYLSLSLFFESLCPVMAGTTIGSWSPCIPYHLLRPDVRHTKNLLGRLNPGTTSVVTEIIV